MKLSFRVLGEGQPLLLLHGLFGMSDNLTAFAKMLAGEGYKVFLIDLRNHGHSPHDAIHNYPVMAADIAELVKEQQLEKVIAVGHSMGGKVVMQFANDFPQFVKALVVIDIAPYAYPVHHKDIIHALRSVDLDKIQTRNEAEAVLKNSIDDNGTRQFLLKNLHWKNEKLEWRFNLDAIEQQIEAIGKPTFPVIVNNVPVLFVRGANSHYIQPDREGEITELYCNAEFVTIEGAGHWIHAEKPNELFAAIKDFLKKFQ